MCTEGNSVNLMVGIQQENRKSKLTVIEIASCHLDIALSTFPTFLEPFSIAHVIHICNRKWDVIH